MKIAIVGDFHGKFPVKLQRRIRQEEPDLIISVGDYPDSTKLRDLEFKYWDDLKKNDLDLVDIVGVKKMIKLMNEVFLSLQKVIGQLGSFDIPVIAIAGNSDSLGKDVKKYELKGVETICSEVGIKLLKTNTKKFNDWIIAGFSGYRGAIEKKLISSSKRENVDIMNFNKKWENRLKKLFARIKVPSKTILIIHDMPKGYFDLVKNKKSPLNGKHVGDEYFIKYIKKHKPVLVVGGHMHEYQGKKKIGATTLINCGPAYEGKMAILNLDDKTGKVGKINFVK